MLKNVLRIKFFYLEVLWGLEVRQWKHRQRCLVDQRLQVFLVLLSGLVFLFHFRHLCRALPWVPSFHRCLGVQVDLLVRDRLEFRISLAFLAFRACPERLPFRLGLRGLEVRQDLLGIEYIRSCSSFACGSRSLCRQGFQACPCHQVHQPFQVGPLLPEVQEGIDYLRCNCILGCWGGVRQSLQLHQLELRCRRRRHLLVPLEVPLQLLLQLLLNRLLVPVPECQRKEAKLHCLPHQRERVAIRSRRVLLMIHQLAQLQVQ